MADETTVGAKSLTIDAVQKVGFPIVCAFLLFWFCWKTIDWERSVMIPTIQSNTDVLRKTNENLEHANMRADAEAKAAHQ